MTRRIDPLQVSFSPEILAFPVNLTRAARFRSTRLSTIHTSSPATFSSFAELSLRKTSQEALSRMNISTPTRIQAETLPVLLDGRDVIGQSRTGSGKTLAFGIPAVESVDPGVKAVQVLVLTPTR
jgi:superfamily II DNA/RNA helicase